MSFQYLPADPSNYTANRAAYGYKISEITLHHEAADMTVEQLAELWRRPWRNGSSTYGIRASDIAQYVREQDIPWTNSDWAANCRAVTIEIANSGGAPNWPISQESLATTIRLVADIARRNNLGKLVPGKNLTWHSMYAATACPGPFLLGKMQTIADQANAINAEVASGGAAPVVIGTGAEVGKLKIFAPMEKTVSSRMVQEGVVARKGFDDVVRGYNLAGDARMARGYTADSLSAVFEAMRAELQPGEVLVAEEGS